MEPNFQTSFIPKKPMVNDRTIASHPVGLFTILSIFILLTMLVVSGGLYFYKTILTKNISQMENDLNLAKSRFEPAKITQLKVLDQRLRASNEILASHIAISPIFTVLQDVTMKSVRFNKFSYTLNTDKEPRVVVKMSGQALGYRSVALQSDLFTQNSYFRDPVFSNLSLDDKGNVLFDLSFSVDPVFIDYRQTLKTQGVDNNNNQNTQPVINTILPDDNSLPQNTSSGIPVRGITN